MKKTAWFIGSAAAAAWFGLASLPAAASTRVHVQIGQTAHPRHVAPAPLWVPGHWQWNGYQQVWVAGHWRAPQPVYGHPGYGYVRPGHGYVQPGYAYGPGHGHGHGLRRDQDRDGIPNRYDRDRDGDGVPNRFDRRPNNHWRH
ncbi:thrombospondin type 3 repeat-containing protein [Ramlibacter tataouinensis]|uniref:Uncharacterized protein n=1 Tax=Ramlibacter tataouinensis (strain ATCC BAA-407 / DSM 14655 / LMG 21543 / TTB310) TaxID=365046 RepID=F5Y2L4_RAMTT|nr:thrombospondin type 3 repeat-containing protein [Ramlibacter tataouinensis]AEG92377.1 hypothetical protein Rta_12900 [Ramlibacter tataouinensis TTB310]